VKEIGAHREVTSATATFSLADDSFLDGSESVAINFVRRSVIEKRNFREAKEINVL
jgi:hypothetical protein